MKKVDKKIVLELLKNKHVVAVDNELKPRIRKGKEIPEEECIRVYVKQKLPVHVLTAEEIIPQKIDGIATDIIDAGGEIVALKKPLTIGIQEIDPTTRIRPLTAGVSIGNVAITAGTLGWFYQDKNGVKYLGSNAHVFTPNTPFDPPEKISPTEIVQPGTYDGGKSPDDLVGHYVWHQQLQPDSTNVFNKMDFAVSTIEVDCDFKIWQQYSPTKLVGHLFAGSNEVTVVFKGKYIADAGYSPLNAQFVEVNEGDWVEKWGRTSGHKTGQVQSASAACKVNYGNNRYALFDDQIITDNISAGGDSVVGDSRMFYLENGNLKFGTIEEIYKSFTSGNQISVPTLKKGSHIKEARARYPTFGDAYLDFTKAMVVYHGVKPVWRVTLHNGKSIEITEDHSLFSPTGGSPTNAMFPSVLKDLKNVVTVEDYGFEGKELNISDDLLTLLGLWIADGSYEKKDGRIGGIAISTGNEKGILKFLEKFKFRPKSKGDYRKDSVELARFIYRLCGDVDCYSKRVPHILFTASKRQIGLFLKGYFSGDGSIHMHGDDYVIVDCASVNRKLLEDVQILLNRLGIRSNIDVGYVPTKLSKRRQYKLKIEGKINVEKFLRYVGFLKEFDHKFYDILKTQNSSLKHERPLSARSIRTIEYVGEKPVFDFKVNPTEIFIANGIVCHNSGSSVWLTSAPPTPPPSRFMEFTKYAIKLFGFQIGTIEEVP